MLNTTCTPSRRYITADHRPALDLALSAHIAAADRGDQRTALAAYGLFMAYVDQCRLRIEDVRAYAARQGVEI